MKILGRITGFLILIGIVATALFMWNKKQGGDGFFRDIRPENVTLTGFVSADKIALLSDPAVTDFLLKESHIRLDCTRAGSLEMILRPLRDTDFLWPSGQVSLSLYSSLNPTSKAMDETVFNTPVVLYSWDTVTDALIREEIVRVENGIHYVSDFPKLIRYILDRKNWADIGLPNMYGSMGIVTADPTVSGSGIMFAGLLANVLNNNEVVTSDKIESLLPRIHDFYKRIGFMERSTGDLFNQYITTGQGAKPIIVGYESQLIEFAMQNREAWPRLKDKIRILYPEPTVWSPHPLIAVSEPAKALLAVMKNDNVQKIAWEKHGLRSGIIGVQNDTAVLQLEGIPAQIERTLPLPGFAVMDRILQNLTTLNSPGM